MQYRSWLRCLGSRRSTRLTSVTKRDCERELRGRCDVEIVDVLEDPAAAEEDKILATPTLVRKLPEPVRKIIGDLSDLTRERVAGREAEIEVTLFKSTGSSLADLAATELVVKNTTPAS